MQVQFVLCRDLLCCANRLFLLVSCYSTNRSERRGGDRPSPSGNAISCEKWPGRHHRLEGAEQLPADPYGSSSGISCAPSR